MAAVVSKVSPCLWFDGQAEEAARFYVSCFQACGQPAEIGAITHYTAAGPRPEGTVLTVRFTLAGQDFLALNAGPEFTFSPAISLAVSCEDQAELDRFWERLSDGGTLGQCSWLTDRFGVSWQLFPVAVEEMLLGPDPAARDRMMRALMTMTKLDVAALRRAYDGAPAG